jgi:hypothetical protein
MMGGIDESITCDRRVGSGGNRVSHEAFAREDYEEKRLDRASRASMKIALRARRGLYAHLHEIQFSGKVMNGNKPRVSDLAENNLPTHSRSFCPTIVVMLRRKHY